jgi:hypothetical protein
MIENTKFKDYDIDVYTFENLYPKHFIDGAILASKYLYEGRCSADLLIEEFLHRKDSINIFFRKKGKVVGFFQYIKLTNSSSLYLSMAVIHPNHRNMGLYKFGIFMGIEHAFELNYKHLVGRTANPLVIGILNRLGFKPKTENDIDENLRSLAENIISEYRGSHTPITKDMICPGRANTKFIPIIQKSKDNTIDQYSRKKLNILTGERFVFIKNINEYDNELFQGFLTE